MKKINIQPWQHSHTFGQDQKRSGEQLTKLVVVMTVVMMAAEITAGVFYGSMALLADGLHMASHTAALSINIFAYAYARRHAGDARFSFGTGKVNALGGFTGAVLLAVFALIMSVESVRRLLSPVSISFNQAIIVAVIGLLVNGISALILQRGGHEHHDHGHDHPHHHEAGHHHHQDHNLQSAYLHVLADALTSLLAILALFAAKYIGWTWMDPLMGIFGAVLIFRWSFTLLGTTGHVLLDREGPEHLRRKIRESIERDHDSCVADLHLWSVGPNLYSVIISVVANRPKTAEEYKKSLPQHIGLVHVTIETIQCGHESSSAPC